MRSLNGSKSRVKFETIVRLAGWNDTEPGMQIMLGHAGGQWSFQSTEGEGLELPEFVGRDLARLFEQGASGDGLGPTDGWPLPPDRHWLIEGFGTSQVVAMGQADPTQWPLIQAAMVVYKVHQLLLAGVFEPDHAVTAVYAKDAHGGQLSIDAGWSRDGFVYRHVTSQQPHLADVKEWPREGSTTDLEGLLPFLGGYKPVLVHPVAAWAILGAIESLDSEPSLHSRHVWESEAVRAIARCKGKVDEAVPAAPAEFTSRLVSLSLDGQGVTHGSLAVTYAGETRHYGFTASELGGGWQVEFDATGDAALQAMASGPPSDFWGRSRRKPAEYRARAHRRFVTGHILEEWIGRLSQSGLLGVVPTTAADIEGFRRSHATRDDDERGWDDWEVLGGKTD